MYNNPSKILLITIVLLCITSWCFATGDTTRVYFRLDVPIPEQDAISKLDSLLYLDAINASQELLIIGYADHLGTNTYNDTLSKKRANNVKGYLVSMGIPEKNVTLVTGRGEVPRDVELPKGYAADRRVDIVVLSGKKASMPAKTKIAKPSTVPLRQAISLNTTTVFDPATIEVGQLFVLDRIFFHTGRHVVVDESLPEMERLYKVLDENPTVEIRIEGHVCCVHPSVDALDL
ncbi:MAG: OmpA family protein, partial [Taibaiella sp.]|nr:OmpA family protein [Taibaiella sp.]